MRKLLKGQTIKYGCSAWSVAQECGEGYTKQTIVSLNGLQAKAARIIGGAHKATPDYTSLMSGGCIAPPNSRIFGHSR